MLCTIRVLWQFRLLDLGGVVESLMGQGQRRVQYSRPRRGFIKKKLASIPKYLFNTASRTMTISGWLLVHNESFSYRVFHRLLTAVMIQRLL